MRRLALILLAMIAAGGAAVTLSTSSKGAGGSYTVRAIFDDAAYAAQGEDVCNVLLDVWNAGQGKAVYFFHTNSSHVCYHGAITTGGVGPYPATIKSQGKYFVLDVPVPAYVSFPLPGLEGSLVTENLNWPKKTTKVKGKTVAYLASVACLNGKRPYSTSFTAETAKNGGIRQDTTLSGTTTCSK